MGVPLRNSRWGSPQELGRRPPPGGPQREPPRSHLELTSGPSAGSGLCTVALSPRVCGDLFRRHRKRNQSKAFENMLSNTEGDKGNRMPENSRPCLQAPGEPSSPLWP